MNFCRSGLFSQMSNKVLLYSDLVIGEVIGSGAFGDIAFGTYKPTGERVAVKTISRFPSSSNFEDVFEREVEMLGILDGPFLLPFIGYTDKEPFIMVTKFTPNGTLMDALRDDPKKLQLNGTDLTLIAYGIAKGLEFVHAQGLMHRDIKSENVFLDENKLPVIGDFGSARRHQAERQLTGSVGTVSYSAPELIEGGEYDNSVDVYSFGVVMWEMLTREVPWQGFDSTQVLFRVVLKQEKLMLPSDAPQMLAEMIASTWSTDPTERPTFSDIIEKFVDGSVVFPGGDPTAVSTLITGYEPVLEDLKTTDQKAIERTLVGLERASEEDFIADTSALNALLSFATTTTFDIFRARAVKIATKCAQYRCFYDEIGDPLVFLSAATLDVFLYVVAYRSDLLDTSFVDKICTIIDSSPNHAPKCTKLLYLLGAQSQNFFDASVEVFKPRVSNFADLEGGDVMLLTLSKAQCVVVKDIHAYQKSSISENIVAAYRSVFNSVGKPIFEQAVVVGHITSDSENVRSAALNYLRLYVDVTDNAIVRVLLNCAVRFCSNKAVLLLCVAAATDNVCASLCTELLDSWIVARGNAARCLMQLFTVISKDDVRFKTALLAHQATPDFLATVACENERRTIKAVCWFLVNVEGLVDKDMATRLMRAGVSEYLCDGFDTKSHGNGNLLRLDAIRVIAAHCYCPTFIPLIPKLLDVIQAGSGRSVTRCVLVLSAIANYDRARTPLRTSGVLDVLGTINMEEATTLIKKLQ